MAEAIKDGTGSGYMARVDEHNYLSVMSVSKEHSFHHSKYHENLFNIHTEHTIQVGSTLEKIINVQYTGTDQFVISRMIMCTDEAAASGLTSFAIHVNPANVAGGVAVTPVNMNFSSNKTAALSVLGTNDGATAITSDDTGTKMWCIRQRLMGTYEYDTDNSLILGQGDSIMMIVSATSVGTKVRTTFTGFVEGD